LTVDDIKKHHPFYDEFIEIIIDIYPSLGYTETIEEYTANIRRDGPMSEMSVMGVMKSIIPITRFNKGEASRIFEEVENSGTKVVMKNNRPACVLMSPEKYESLMEMLSDYILLEEAENRMAHFDPKETISQTEMMESLGITDADLDEIEVEIE
jgi:PHD/YefM family antitoxin component YafN of YafNO toxin-antitoxin module